MVTFKEVLLTPVHLSVKERLVSSLINTCTLDLGSRQVLVDKMSPFFSDSLQGIKNNKRLGSVSKRMLFYARVISTNVSEHSQIASCAQKKHRYGANLDPILLRRC